MVMTRNEWFILEAPTGETPPFGPPSRCWWKFSMLDQLRMANTWRRYWSIVKSDSEWLIGGFWLPSAKLTWKLKISIFMGKPAVNGGFSTSRVVYQRWHERNPSWWGDCHAGSSAWTVGSMLHTASTAALASLCWTRLLSSFNNS